MKESKPVKSSARRLRMNGEGQIRFRKHDNRWEYRLRANGTRISISATRKSDLLRKVADEKARNGGTIKEPSRFTVALYVAHWLKAHVKPNLKASTQATYEATLESHVLPLVGNYRLDRVDGIVVDKLYATLRKKGVGEATLEKVHTVLSSVFSSAVRQRRLTQNPMTQVRGPKARSRRMICLDPAQAKRFLSEAKGTTFGSPVLSRRDDGNAAGRDLWIAMGGCRSKAQTTCRSAQSSRGSRSTFSYDTKDESR